MPNGPVLATAMLLAALPSCAAAQQADGLCPDLRLVMQTMPERNAFTAAAPALPLALFEQCRAHRVDFVDEVICTWRLPSDAPAVERLAAEAMRCLPAARRDDDPAEAPGQARLVYELLIITIGQDQSAPGPSRARLVVSVVEG